MCRVQEAFKLPQGTCFKVSLHRSVLDIIIGMHRQAYAVYARVVMRYAGSVYQPVGSVSAVFFLDQVSAFLDNNKNHEGLLIPDLLSPVGGTPTKVG